jgi:hypothetical protein
MLRCGHLCVDIKFSAAIDQHIARPTPVRPTAYARYELQHHKKNGGRSWSSL